MSHMFLKEKRDRKIKGRTMYGGTKLREFIPKEDSISLTVATKAVIMSCIIYTEEERDVYVINITNAFIQTRVDNENEMAVINIRGFLVDLLPDIDPDFYEPFVTTDKKGAKH